jgi:hypothetical protein
LCCIADHCLSFCPFFPWPLCCIADHCLSFCPFFPFVTVLYC